jgi:hypothetical protein
MVGNVKDLFKVEVFQLGVILFKLLFKVYPFTPSSYEDPSAKDPHFIHNFILSSKNVHKIELRESLKDLL